MQYMVQQQINKQMFGKLLTFNQMKKDNISDLGTFLCHFI